MTTALLIALAAGLLGGREALAKARDLLATYAPHLTARHAIAAAVLAVAAWSWTSRPAAPTPAPDAGPLVLRGLFRGPTAAEDATTIAGLCEELAAEIEWDAMQAEPMLATGVALDTLRERARMLRCRGVSIGERQPVARDAIAAYLDRTVGKSGGPLTPETRAAWISAFRDISRAAADVTR